MLLAPPGLLVRSLVVLQRVDPGFLVERAVSIQLLLPAARYPTPQSMRAFYRRLRDEAQSLPGASASAIATTMPLSGSDIGVGFTIEGRPVDPGHTHVGGLFRYQPGLLLDDGHSGAARPRIH